MSTEISLLSEVELIEPRTRDVSGNMHSAIVLHAEAVDRSISWRCHELAVLDIFRDAMAQGRRVTLTLCIHADEEK
jgi:hypothetical protein